MRVLETDIKIDAPPQTVWSIMDDLERYPEWNAAVPELAGRTTVDEIVRGRLTLPNMPEIPLSPTLIRIVGARELRWITISPNPGEFSAEHIFILKPTEDGGTHLYHNEIFDGAIVEGMWPALDTNARQAYNDLNKALKKRAEAMVKEAVKLHPAVDNGTAKPRGTFAGATLKCKCASDKVEVAISEACSHNHLCVCSKCWKPDGALFAQVAVVPKGTLAVTANEKKLKVVDPSQSIQRHACTGCGVHMFGRVENKDHHFYGLEFIHPELSQDAGWPAPEFAAFVSSIIETGARTSHMAAVRAKLEKAGLEAYDAFSPELMDIIAWHKVKLAKFPKAGA